jgi:hypothetical protein
MVVMFEESGRRGEETRVKPIHAVAVQAGVGTCVPPVAPTARYPTLAGDAHTAATMSTASDSPCEIDQADRGHARVSIPVVVVSLLQLLLVEVVMSLLLLVVVVVVWCCCCCKLSCGSGSGGGGGGGGGGVLSLLM